MLQTAWACHTHTHTYTSLKCMLLCHIYTQWSNGYLSKYLFTCFYHGLVNESFPKSNIQSFNFFSVLEKELLCALLSHFSIGFCLFNAILYYYCSALTKTPNLSPRIPAASLPACNSTSLSIALTMEWLLENAHLLLSLPGSVICEDSLIFSE